MANYKYDVDRECFVRDDNRGKPLYVNITEAQKIILQLNLGYTLNEIQGKVSLSSPQGTVTTIKSFIRNYKAGNIEIPDDAPVPVRVFENVDESNRIDELEERIENLENMMDKYTLTRKVKSWIGMK